MAFDALKSVGKKLDETATDLGHHVSKAKEEVVDFAAEKKKMLDEFEHEKKMFIANQIRSKLDHIFDYSMQTFADHIKDKVDDPYMPRCVKQMFDDLIDAFWPDVKDEFKDVILTGVSGGQTIAHGEPPCCCNCSPIGFLRYNIWPYDRNVWRKIRNPLWWLFMIASVFPKFGVSQICYGTMFLFIDRDDEFQLMSFILYFKALQFISLGILSALIGSVQYYVCTSVDDCDTYAPQESAWTIALFVAQIILVWLAFLMLPCSRRKGGQFWQMKSLKKQQARAEGRSASSSDVLTDIAIGDMIIDSEVHEANQEQKARSRGRLMKFLIYDFIVFLICVGIGCFMAFKNYTDEQAQLNNNDDVNNESGGNWKFKSGLYWLKAFYGLMSFPFALLIIPGINSLLSHAKPTGYNHWGNCVPYIGHEEEKPTPWRPYTIDVKTGQRVSEPIF